MFPSRIRIPFCSTFLVLCLIWVMFQAGCEDRSAAQAQDIAKIKATDPKNWSLILSHKPASYLNELGLVPYTVGGWHRSTAYQDGDGNLWLVAMSGPPGSIAVIDGPWIKEP